MCIRDSPNPLPFAVSYEPGTDTLFLSVHPEEKEILSCRCAGVTADDGGAPGGPGSGQQSAPGDEMNLSLIHISFAYKLGKK